MNAQAQNYLASIGIDTRPGICGGPRRLFGCGNPVELPGICEACARKIDEGAHNVAMQSARDSVPEHFRWASAEHPQWERFVCESARKAYAAMQGIPRCGLMIVGPKGQGKTSVACAILNRLHSKALFDSPANQVEIAKRAVFVSAPELLESMTEGRAKWAPPSSLAVMARMASILVLDEVGEGDCRSGDEVWKIMQARHNRDRPVIGTSWRTEEQMAEVYGGGFARRMYERVIQC